MSHNLYMANLTEKEIINKLKELKGIRPSTEWVLNTRAGFLPARNALHSNAGGYEKPKFSFLELFSFRRVLSASLVLVLIAVSTVLVSDNSLPGDSLYAVKKMKEKFQASMLASGDEKTNFQLKLVDDRLNDLNKITDQNKTRSLAVGIEEVKTTKAEVKKDILNSIQGKGKKEAVKLAKKFAPVLKEIDAKQTEAYASLGIEPKEENSGLEAQYKTIVESEIKYLKTCTLSEESSSALKSAIDYYESGDYLSALISLPKDGN